MIRMTGQRLRALSLLGMALALGACASQQVSTSSGGSSTTQAGVPSLAPVLSVERFLQAANVQDLGTMASLFGTYEGPIPGRREDIELRMNAIAAILSHDDYEIGSETREPGRTHPTQRIHVTLTDGDQVHEDVPFLVVQSRNGSWLIEEIALEEITSR